MKSNKIYGMMMRPCSTTQEDNECVMQSSDLSVTEKFMGEFQKHIVGKQIVAECAKIYILKNWEKITDWSNLEVVMEDANTLQGHLNGHNGGNPLEDYVEYFKYTGRRAARLEKLNDAGRDTMGDFLQKKDDEDKLRHNPATSVSDVVLDTSDGDFSLVINGRSHMWISDTTVIIIAEYIEKQLAVK